MQSFSCQHITTTTDKAVLKRNKEKSRPKWLKNCNKREKKILCNIGNTCCSRYTSDFNSSVSLLFYSILISYLVFSNFKEWILWIIVLEHCTVIPINAEQTSRQRFVLENRTRKDSSRWCNIVKGIYCRDPRFFAAMLFSNHTRPLSSTCLGRLYSME